MIALLFGFLLITSARIDPTLALIITCPTAIAPTIRYNMILSSPAMGSYTGTLLLSSNGNFISLLTIPASESPQSAIQGTWSLSECTNVLTFNAQTFYFMDLPHLSVNNITCIYTCGTDINALRNCTIIYSLKTLKTTGTYLCTMDLSLPE